MRQTHILMYNGKPIIVSDNDTKLHLQAVMEAKGATDREFPQVEWNTDQTRLFRVAEDGRKRFSGYEVRQAVKA